MEQKTIIEASYEDLKKLFAEPIRKEVRAEIRAKYNDRIVGADAVAMIHGVSVDTVYAYAKTGEIEHLDRITENSSFKFRLGDVLEFDFKELRKKLRNKKS
jgi:hypothetical protein